MFHIFTGTDLSGSHYNTQKITIQPQVVATTLPTTTVYTDESTAYNRVPDSGRERQTVCHSQGEYARDEDALVNINRLVMLFPSI